jgi:tetratricopeptide (TPR) repeat protein
VLPNSWEALPLMPFLPSGYQEGKDILKIFATTEIHGLANHPLLKAITAISSQNQPFNTEIESLYERKDWIAIQMEIKVVDKVSKKEGKEIQEIRAENVQISKNQLSLQELLLKGNDHLYRKEYSEAINYYEKVIGLDPNYAIAWNNKGFALENFGKSKEAIKCYDKAIELSPNYANAWNGKGMTLIDLRFYQEALEYLDKAIEIDPNLNQAWYNKAIALDNIGKHEEAIKCYEKTIDIEPTDPVAQYYRDLARDKLKKKNVGLDNNN